MISIQLIQIGRTLVVIRMLKYLYMNGKNLILQCIYNINGLRINVIRTEFILKCSIEKYINQNADKLKEINKKIEDYRIVEDVPEYNESIRYISYKGMLLFPGRDFIYFKKSH